MIRRFSAYAAGGAASGLFLGAFPYVSVFSEIRNFQIVLLEYSYQALGKGLPTPALRFFGTFSGELLVLAGIGAVLGLVSGILTSPFSRKEKDVSIASQAAAGAAWAAGLFLFLAGIMWCRIVLIHSSNSRMFSTAGLMMALCSGAAGGLAGFLCLKLFRSRWGALGLLVLLSAYLGIKAAASLTGSPGEKMPEAPQVILFGADGATWDVALPMIRAGKLPNLARLMKQGTWGDVRTTLPWKSPILWTSIATGKREAEHGIHDFVVRDPVTAEIRPVAVNARKVRSIWEIAGTAGRRVDVVNWYGAWPAEEVNGTMVSSRFTVKDFPGRLTPPERMAELVEAVGDWQSSAAPGEQELAEGTLAHAEAVREDERVFTQLALHLLEKDKPDFHLMYLREIDDMQHFFWQPYALRKGSLLGRLLYGAKPAEEEKAKRIEAAYERMDAALGGVLEKAGPQTIVVLVSDHGGGIKAPGELNFTLNKLLLRWGWLRLEGDGQDHRRVDWSGTSLYDSTKRPWYESRAVFINRRPERPSGAGLDKAGERKLLEQAAGRLRGLKTESGQPVFTRVRLIEGGKEGMHLEVEVNVRLKPGDTVIDPGFRMPVSEMVWPKDLTGTHRMHGLIAMAGPGIRKNYKLRAASILDVAPTVLYFFGLPAANDMQGKVLLDAVEPAARSARPVRTVATYETSPRLSDGPQAQPGADEALVERLRSLGYVQ